MASRLKSSLLLTALLLSGLLLLGGCISIGPPPGDGTGQPTATPPGGVATAGPPSGNAPRVPLSFALDSLPAAEKEGLVDTRGMNLTRVWGYQVDSGGLAKTWVLGMRGGGKTTVLSYTDGKFLRLDLPAALPEEDLQMGSLLSPEELFRENLNTIVREMDNLRVGECDLVLEGGAYQVIIHSGSGSATLTFNAGKPDGRRPATPSPPGTTPPSPGSRGRLALPVLVPLGAAALAILGSRRRH